MTEQEPQYTEITVLVHPDVVEGLVDVLLSLGAKGVVEERRLLAFHVTAYVPADDKNEERVRAIRDRLHALEAAGLRVGPGTIGVRTVGVEAWSEAWQDLFQVQRITPSLVLAPSWEEYQAQPGETVVLADLKGPGIVNHIWLTIADNEYAWPRLLRIRVYYDGHKTPSVDAPIGD